MRHTIRVISIVLVLVLLRSIFGIKGYAQVTKPFTRWWWMGSAINKEGIKYNLEEFKKVGLGGVEITPIYGVKGTENNYLDFLSPAYLEMLDYTCHIADSLGLKVDMVLGTGWPYGGPQVEPEFAATKLEVDSIRVQKGEKVNHLFSSQNPNTTLLHVLAYGDNAYYKDLSSQLIEKKLNWIAPTNLILYGIYAGKTRQKVKRAAPGGEGFTVDHFSQKALKDYLEPFDEKLNTNIRAVFNDSYEVYGTDFTPNFFNEFLKRRAYDLKPYLNLIIEKVDSPIANKVRSDYRETLSDLLKEEFNQNWTKWAHQKGYKSKLQAHGSPGNLLDLYATADIPECETFGSMPFEIPGFRRESSDIREGDANPIMLKFSSSASHMAGKSLTSSESFTWLRDHFKVSLSQCKPELEELFLNGINHVFLHGSTYSPPQATWPGWKFYAATNFSPQMSIWKDSPALFTYIKNCQELLQSGQPNNEIALYWPVHDIWNSYNKGELFFQFKIHSLEEWLLHTPFYKTGQSLINAGYSLDFFSDDFVQSATFQNGEIQFKGASYKAIVIPSCENMPLNTLQKLITLKKEGAPVFFESQPSNIPGLKEKSQEFDVLTNSLETSQNIISALQKEGVSAEELVSTGLKFIKRKDGDKNIYYVVNHLSKGFEGYIPLNIKNDNISLLDPDTGEEGLATIVKDSLGISVKLHLPAGKSIFIIGDNKPVSLTNWSYATPDKIAYKLKGPFDLTFTDGYPIIKNSYTLNSLQSWTELSKEAEAFSGTATYTCNFKKPKNKAKSYLLRLPDVRESAKVWINGKYLGTLWANPFEIKIDKLKNKKNQLKIEVTNLDANRIRAKELRGEEWKIFHEINMVNKDYKTFDATLWLAMPSGIIGDIELIPLLEK